MTHSTICGHLMSDGKIYNHLSSYNLSQFSTLEYHTKAFLMIVKVIPHFTHTLRNLRTSSKLTIELSMPNQSQHLSLPNHPPPHFPLTHPQKLISLLTTTSRCVSILTRLMSSSNCFQKALLWILFNSGQAIPEFILFSMRYTLHPRCVLNTHLPILFSYFQRLGCSC